MAEQVCEREGKVSNYQFERGELNNLPSLARRNVRQGNRRSTNFNSTNKSKSVDHWKFGNFTFYFISHAHKKFAHVCVCLPNSREQSWPFRGFGKPTNFWWHLKRQIPDKNKRWNCLIDYFLVELYFFCPISRLISDHNDRHVCFIDFFGSKIDNFLCRTIVPDAFGCS